MDGDKRVFLSWSGPRSKAAAEVFVKWLPNLVNAARPWMSSNDIGKGAVGLEVIAEQLKHCFLGIVFVTAENKDRPWLNYEAGAISKSVTSDGRRVMTIMVGVNRSEIQGPLGQYQDTSIDEYDDFSQLIHDIDKLVDTGRDKAQIDEMLDALWPKIKVDIDACINMVVDDGSTPAPRSQDSKIDEMLGLLRDLSQSWLITQPRTLQSLVNFARKIDQERQMIPTALLSRYLDDAKMAGERYGVDPAWIKLSSGGYEFSLRFDSDYVDQEMADKVMSELKKLHGRNDTYWLEPFHHQ